MTELQASLAEHSFAETLPHQELSSGWYPAIGELYAHDTFGAIRAVLRTETRTVPSSILINELEARIPTLPQHPVGEDRAALMDAITMELLPQAFPKQSDSQVILDTKNGLAWFDSASPKKVDALSDSLREALGNWRMVPLFAKSDIPSNMKRWLLGNQPNDLAVGDSARLKDHREGGTITVANFALPDDKINDYLNDGMSVDQLELIWNNRIRFSLKSDGTLGKIKPLDACFDEFDETIEDEKTRIDAEQLIMVSEIRGLISSLSRAL